MILKLPDDVLIIILARIGVNSKRDLVNIRLRLVFITSWNFLMVEFVCEFKLRFTNY